MTRPSASPIAVIVLYAGTNSRPDSPKYQIYVEGAGLSNLSPASETQDPWRTVDAALNHAAKVIVEHERREMSSDAPPIALPDFSFEAKERP